MAEDTDRQQSSAARRLAIVGSLITGVAGITMAVYSVVAGQETGGGALLAASALAFGLLAINVDRFPRRAPQQQQGDEPSQVSTEPAPTRVPGSPAENGVEVRRQPSSKAPADAEPLTDREREVLSLVAEGFSNKQIGASLGITVRTVQSHVTAVMTKLRASGRAHAVVTAVRLGWLDL